MTRFFILATATALLSVAACRQRDEGGELASVGRRVGSYKGLAAIESALKTRVFPNDTYFSLGNYLGENNEAGLPSLLGTYDGRPGSSSLQNAAPNAVNTMLWQIVMEGAAVSISFNACAASASTLEAHLKQTAKTICDWPLGSPDRTKTLQEFWLDLMRYDAPKAEMDAWIRHVSTADTPFAALQGQALVKDLTQSILMNPYFLLEP